MRLAALAGGNRERRLEAAMEVVVDILCFLCEGRNLLAANAGGGFAAVLSCWGYQYSSELEL